MSSTIDRPVPVAEREKDLSPFAATVLGALRKTPGEYEDHRSDYTIWRGVLLPNVDIPTNITAHAWAGYLSVLEARDLYRPTNPDCGEVCLGEEPFTDE